MAKRPDRDPAKHSKKDPAKPTRAKAARPDSSPLDPALADILNPAIGHGRAGVGSQTGSPSPHPGRAGARPSASLSGEGGVGGREGKSRASTVAQSPSQTCVASRPPPLSPPHKGEGKSKRRACSNRRIIRSTAAPISPLHIGRGNQHKENQPKAWASGHRQATSAKDRPASIRNWPMRSAMATAIRPSR